MLKSALRKIYGIIKKEKRPAELKELYAVFNNSPHSGWILRPKKGIVLYNLVKQFQPKNILDFGSGVGASSAIMALAGAKVTGVEQYEKCIKIAENLVPKHLMKNINFLHSEPYAFQEQKIT